MSFFNTLVQEINGREDFFNIATPIKLTLCVIQLKSLPDQTKVTSSFGYEAPLTINHTLQMLRSLPFHMARVASQHILWVPSSSSYCCQQSSHQHQWTQMKSNNDPHGANRMAETVRSASKRKIWQVSASLQQRKLPGFQSFSFRTQLLLCQFCIFYDLALSEASYIIFQCR